MNFEKSLKISEYMRGKFFRLSEKNFYQGLIYV